MRINAQQVKEAAQSVYRYATTRTYAEWGMNIDSWDWVPGVGVISVLDYYKACRNESLFTYLREWIERNKQKADKASVINSMAPFAIFPDLYERTRDPYFRLEAKRIGEWMLCAAPRTREGAFEHTVTENASFPEQVWADTVFMAVLFLARLARLEGDPVVAKEAVRQTEIHLRLLQEPETGVLFHGWNCGEAHHMSAARWTRANAWVAMAVPEIVHLLSPVIEIPEEIHSRYRQLMDGLLPYRSSGGLWHTVMDRSDFYEETSGSAGIACGLLKAVRYGLLEPSYKEEAHQTLAAVIGKIDPDGKVSGVSSGTPIMPSIDKYNEIPVVPTLYGQGLTLMLLSEYILDSSSIGGKQIDKAR